MPDMMSTLFAPCEFCQTEGRIYTARGNHPDDVTDHGACPECHGECVVEVETMPAPPIDDERAQFLHDLYRDEECDR